MNNPVLRRRWNLGIYRRAAGAALAFANVLMPTILATSSAQAQTFTSLYSFTGTPDGANPYAGLVRDAKGNLYGTTNLGGNPGCYTGYGCGTVFKVDATGKETVLYSFTGGGDGANPTGGLVRAGNLYGTTVLGGSYGNGTVFKVDKTGKETVLYSFTGGGDGGSPGAGLVRDKQGNLYGTTGYGGGDSSCSLGCGTVFMVEKTGKETVLHSFTVAGGDGYYPNGGLARDKQGNLYGTTLWGGAYNSGTVFKVDSTGKETVLYSFTGGADGNYPVGGVVRDWKENLNLYGTTSFGGACGYGTVYKVDTTGKETVLYSFTGGADGAVPRGALLRAQGSLYGTTSRGGDLGCSGGGCGTVFKVDTTGKETVLHTFTLTDGGYPAAGLVRDKQGNLYGTTVGGGNPACQPGLGGCGTVFKLTP